MPGIGIRPHTSLGNKIRAKVKGPYQWRRNRAPPKFFKEGLSPPKEKSVRRDFNLVNVVLNSVLE